MSKPIIYVFTFDPRSEAYYALAEDGTPLGSHRSSSESWGRNDLGVDDPKHYRHTYYAEHYPHGYEMVWVDSDKVSSHPGLQAAIKLHREARAAREAAEQAS